MIDLTATTDRTRTVTAGVTDVHLDAPTPMVGTPVRELLQHLIGLTVAFRDAAAKLDDPTTSTPPTKVTGPLPHDWRALLDRQLADLADAWRDVEAWAGMTRAGGVDLPGEIGGLAALNEVLLHAWDLARATDQAYEPSDGEADAVRPVVMSPEPDRTAATAVSSSAPSCRSQPMQPPSRRCWGWPGAIRPGLPNIPAWPRDRAATT